jgi:hypothetical protein
MSVMKVDAVYYWGGRRRSATITLPIRHFANARPWLEAHYPRTRFIWGCCLAYRA